MGSVYANPGRAAAKPQTESLAHAVTRMQQQGFSTRQIAGQITKWHPDWTPDQISGAITAHATKAKPTYHKTGSKPFFPGQQPTGRSSVAARGGAPVYTYGHGQPGPSGDKVLKTALGGPAEGQTVQQSQAALGKIYSRNHPAGVQIIEGIANTVPGVALAKALRDGRINAGALAGEAFNDVTSGLLPEAKVAGILGGLKGLKGLRAAADTAKAVEAGRLPSAALIANSRVEVARLKQLHGAITATHDAALAKGAKAPAALAANEKRAARLTSIQDKIAAHEGIIARGGSMSPVEHVQANLRAAKTVRTQQESGYSAERGVRFAKASAHLNNQALAPADRLALAKAELAGELPKINFQGMSELNSESLTNLQSHILNHPYLLAAQKIRASDALTNALAGKVPTRGELTLLEHVFGKETAAGIGQTAGRHPLRDLVLSTLNVPRSLMASFDLSAPFRQGLVVATRHPTIFARNFRSMVKAFGSEKVYQGLLEDIHARPTYPMMMEAKLALTDLGKEVGPREERFASDVAERIPVVGRGVRASGRAYTGYLDKTRADVFDHLIAQAQAQGRNVQDPKFLKSLGSYINAATGRGDLGHFQEAGKVLNTFFFSPRLLASRLNFLNPVFYARLDPFARKEALRSAVQLAGTLSTILALASRVPGVQVVADPRNPDWGKIKLGHTRIDLAGGFQQPLRLLAQLATGTAISSTTGKALNLTANGFGQPTRLDLLVRFFEGKESPWASVMTDWLRNSNQIGQKFSWVQEAVQHMTPLLGQDAASLYSDRNGGMNGIAAAFAGYAVGSVGLGLQTYGPKAPKPVYGQATTGSPYASSGAASYGSVYGSSGGSVYAGR